MPTCIFSVLLIQKGWVLNVILIWGLFLFFLHLRYMYIWICDLMENVFHFKLPYASKLTVTNFQSLVLLFHLAMSNKLKRIIHVFFTECILSYCVILCAHCMSMCMFAYNGFMHSHSLYIFVIYSLWHMNCVFPQISKKVSENTLKINL